MFFLFKFFFIIYFFFYYLIFFFFFFSKRPSLGMGYPTPVHFKSRFWLNMPSPNLPLPSLPNNLYGAFYFG